MSKIPKLRFEEFNTVNEVYVFEDIFSFSTGKNIKQNEASPDFKIPCVRYGELYHMYGEVISKVVNKTNLDKSELSFSEGNEILMPSAGEDPLDIGSASALTIKDVAIGRTINILRPLNKNVYLQKYVSYYINEKLRKKISTLAKGSSISNVYNSDLKKLKIPLPTLEEQEKIASFLTSIDTKIEQLTKKESLLKEYKKGVMQKIFSQEIRFKTDDGSEFCEWEEVKLRKLLKESKIKSTSSGQYEVLSSTKDNIVLQSEYFNREIASKDNTGYKILKVNQLVFSPQNLWMGNINVNTKYDVGIVSPSYKIYDFKQNLLVDYGKYFLKTSRMMYEYGQASEQGASVVRRSLNIDLFNSIKVSLPCVKEQNKIANFLSSIDTKIEQTGKQLEKIKEFKKALLQQMFV